MQKRHRIICRRIDAFDRKSRHAPLNIVVYFVGKERKNGMKKGCRSIQYGIYRDYLFYLYFLVRNEFIESVLIINSSIISIFLHLQGQPRQRIQHGGKNYIYMNEALENFDGKVVLITHKYNVQ